MIAGSVTVVTANKYTSITQNFLDFCDKFKLQRKCSGENLIAWAVFYAEFYTHRSLWGHFSAFSWYCDVHQLYYPPAGGVERRRLCRVMRALKLRDPTVESPCTPLTSDWLMRMLIVVGVTRFADYSTLSLKWLAFFTRVLVGHACMLRLCAYEFGMDFLDLTSGLDRAGKVWQLRVGSIAPGDIPLNARTRKLKFKPERVCVIRAVKGNVLSAGALLEVYQRRVMRHLDKGGALFVDCEGEVISNRAMSARRYLASLRSLATAAGMTAPKVGKLEVRSLRAGGCVDYFGANLPLWWIKQQGGWSSDTVHVYNRPTPLQRASHLSGVSLAHLRNYC